jgi:hypothetical protein
MGPHTVALVSRYQVVLIAPDDKALVRVQVEWHAERQLLQGVQMFPVRFTVVHPPLTRQEQVLLKIGDAKA